MASQLLSTPSTHRWSLSGFWDKALNGVKEVIFRTSWTPLVMLAESIVVLYVVISLSYLMHDDRVLVPRSRGMIRPLWSSEPAE